MQMPQTRKLCGIRRSCLRAAIQAAIESELTANRGLVRILSGFVSRWHGGSKTLEIRIEKEEEA